MAVDAQSRRHLLDGVTRVFLGEALFFPTGLLVVAFLTRRLGPESYGVLALAMAPVLWIEWGVAALFSRAAVKLTGDAPDWRSVGATIVRVHLAAGVLAGLLLMLVAGHLAALLGEPRLAAYLRLFAVDIPLVLVIHAHRSLLVGTGAFRPRALAAGARWTARLLLIVALVEAGLSVAGAILGNIGASLVELAVVRSAIRPPLFGRTAWPARALWAYATPLFVAAASLRLFDRLDLLIFKALGASTQLAGIYGAAQNLALAPRIFNTSVSTLLQATLTQMLRAGHERAAADLSRDAERFALALFPLAGLGAGAAPQLVTLVFGAEYAAAAPLLAVLLFAAVASIQMSVATAILTAVGKPAWTAWLAWPLVPLAAVGHLLAIPRLGAFGAAVVTMGCAVLGAAACVLAVRRACGVAPPPATLGRSLFLTACAYLAAVTWSSGGPRVLLELGLLVVAVVAGFVALGEIRVRQRPLAWPAAMSPPSPPAGQGESE